MEVAIETDHSRLREDNSSHIQHGARKLAAMAASTGRWFAQAGLTGLALLFAIGLGTGANAADAVVGRESGAAIRARVVKLVNEARSHARRCGRERFAAAPALHVSRKLNDAAAVHARDMARRNYFDHRGSDGSQPRDRVLRTGYRFRLTGENIALGPESAEEVVAGWLDSPGHCANIMESRFREIGIGLARGRKRGQIYWVQSFGAPR
jgi:uncharacterized protein YkwD